MNRDYRTVVCSTWTPEQVTEHLRRIGAPPKREKKFTSITAPQKKQGSQKYSRRGGEW